MNSRERILAAIDCKRLDRIPTDIWATGEVWGVLRSHFGSHAAVLDQLHIDGFAWVGTPYIGPAVPVSGDETCDYWGVRRKIVDYGTGAYEEQTSFPLADAKTIDDLERYQWPCADWFDYSGVKEQAQASYSDRAVQAGYMAPFYYHNMLRGLEQSLFDPHDDPEFTHRLLEHLSDFFYEHHRRIFEAADGMIDVVQVTDDFGSQTGPMISLETFHEFYKPHMQLFIDLCHSFGIKVFHHDDGSIRQFLPDLVEMGIDILNPVQWTCPGMELDGLKKDFGGHVCFHGAVENQRILPFGTPEEVRAEVRHCIDTLASDGTGYILASCHNIQPVTPIENIIAMYDEAYHYGRMG